MSEPTAPSGPGGSGGERATGISGALPPPSHPRHRAIHRNFRRTMLGMVISLPVLILFWAYNRTVACWAHGGAGSFEFWVCPNSGFLFGFYLVLLLLALAIVHWPVAIPGAEPPPPLPRRTPWIARVRPRRSRDNYRRGFGQLDAHTQDTLHFTDFLLPVVAALAVALVFGVPRLLR